MRKVVLLGFVLILCVGGMLFAFAPDDVDEDEIAVNFASLPQAVQDAATGMLGEGKILTASKENEDGVTLFEVSDEAARKEIKISAQGSIIEVEEEIEADELPGLIRRKLNRRLPGAKIIEAEAVTLLLFEVKVEKDGKTHEIMMDAAGRVVRGNDEDENHRGDDDDDNDEGDDDQGITLSEVPAAALAAVRDRFPGAEIDEASVENEDGQIVYELEVELDANGKEVEYEVEVTADGKILKVEDENDDDDDEHEHEGNDNDDD